ncbi:MAG: antibiotic biosynthesis monooxygenase [Acidimicrobiia bacterium]|nr:antibiotic biosynthesis monooxygenase [Acidimicrobiia bacterium]
MSDRRSPTVIVSRTVLPEREEEFSMWVTRLITAAYQSPGYVSAGIERPNSTHPDEWLVVYRFESGPSLDAWLASTAREELLAEGASLFEGEAIEQIVAGVSGQDEVRVVSNYRLRPGAEIEHIVFHQRLLDTLNNFNGFIRGEILDAVPGVQPDTVVTLTFDTKKNLMAWIESDERVAAIADLETLTEGDLTTSIVGGFAGWFPISDSAEAIPKWKQGVVVLLALYPTVVFTSYLARWFWPDLNLFVAIFIGNVISVAILTWVLMPAITSKLAGWLNR